MTNAKNDFWFLLPDGSTAKELEVTEPVKGRRTVPATMARELDICGDLVEQSMEKRGWSLCGSISDRVRECIRGYERIAAESLEGSSSVRDDMVVMLRSVLFVLETVVGEHLNHSQKNERIRGCMSVLEKHVQTLRDARFDFRDTTWNRYPDLFRWDEPERRLRDRIRDLEEQLKSKNGRGDDEQPF